jgi:DNA ligase-associated metallophosphoesterase
MERLRSVDVTLAGELLSLRGDRSLFWRSQRALVVADLHLGKAESLRADGVALPDGAMFDDLVRLTAALQDTEAARLIILGDLVHDARGLTSSVREFVTRWRRTVPVAVDLVLGNHDRRLDGVPDEWGMAVHASTWSIGDLVLAHEPPGRACVSLHGHIHPAIRLSGAVDGVRVPCFHVQRTGMTLPAFSTLTSGATIRPEAGDRCIAVVEGYVYEMP